MAELRKLVELRHLSLDSHHITNVGLKHLTHLPQLQHLDLYGAQIDNSGLLEITRLRKLRFLDITDTKVTIEGVNYLKNAFPSLHLLYSNELDP